MSATLEGAAYGMPAVGVVAVALGAPGVALLYGGRASARGLQAALLRFLVVVAVLAAQWLLVGRWMVLGAGAEGLHLEIAGRMVLGTLIPVLVASAYGRGLSLAASLAFAVAWSTFVFEPVARWFERGWLRHLGVLDSTGGISLHLAAGVAAVVCAHTIRSRDVALDDGAGGADSPGRVVVGGVLLAIAALSLTVAGTIGSPGLLWSIAPVALGAAGGASGWLAVTWCDGGRSTLLGAVVAAVTGCVAMAAGADFVTPSASFAIGWIAGAVSTAVPAGFVAGSLGSLLAITAAAGYVSPATAIAIGCMAAALCYFTVWVKGRFASGVGSDVFGVHGVGGLIGALLTGVFAQRSPNGGAAGALFGHLDQLVIQLVACAATAVYVGATTRLLMLGVERTVGWALRYRSASAVDSRPEARAVRSSGVFQSHAFGSDRIEVESQLDGPAPESARAFKS